MIQIPSIFRFFLCALLISSCATTTSKIAALKPEPDDATPASGARLRRVPTYLYKLNKAFTTRFFKMHYHKGSTFTLQKTELSSS